LALKKLFLVLSVVIILLFGCRQTSPPSQPKAPAAPELKLPLPPGAPVADESKLPPLPPGAPAAHESKLPPLPPGAPAADESKLLPYQADPAQVQKPTGPQHATHDPLDQMTPPPRSLSASNPSDVDGINAFKERIRSVIKAGRNFSSFYPILLDIAKHLDPKPADVIADIGAGTGIFCLTLLEHEFTFNKLFAVDIGQLGLDLFAFTLGQKNYKSGQNVELVLSSEKDVALPPNEIDVALIIDSPFFVESRLRDGSVSEDNTEWFGSLHNAMKSDGRVHIYNIASILNFIESDRQLTRPFEQNKFRLQKKETITFPGMNLYLHLVFVKK
jgi:predicted RNA methylase